MTKSFFFSLSDDEDDEDDDDEDDDLLFFDFLRDPIKLKKIQYLIYFLYHSHHYDSASYGYGRIGATACYSNYNYYYPIKNIKY